MIFDVYSTDNDCLTESSIAEPLPSRDVIADHWASVTYHLVEERTKRGRAMLLDSLGFTYNINTKLALQPRERSSPRLKPRRWRTS